MISFSDIMKKIGFRQTEAGGSTQITNTNLKQFIIKHLGYKPDSDDYTGAESDLAEVRSAIETDSYIKVALDKTFQLVFKAGYKMSSKNEKAVEYLKQRLAVMSFGTGMPWDVMLEEMARDLVFYSNAFWVKSRVDKIMDDLTVGHNIRHRCSRSR